MFGVLSAVLSGEVGRGVKHLGLATGVTSSGWKLGSSGSQLSSGCTSFMNLDS